MLSHKTAAEQEFMDFERVAFGLHVVGCLKLFYL